MTRSSNSQQKASGHGANRPWRQQRSVHSLAALTDLLPINAELNSSGFNLFDDETNGATEDKTY